MMRPPVFRQACALCLAVFLWHGIQASAADANRSIELSVDASEAPRKLLHARLVIPAAPGPLTLYYPKWIPGEHMPNGPINDLSGLTIRAGGRPIAWKRDDVDLYAFHCTVPKGADAIEVTLDYLGTAAKEGYSASASMTARLAVLNWHLVLLYPQGASVREQRVRARLTLPKGWKLSTALPIEAVEGATTQFQTVSLETLADSTVLCGAYLKEVPLGPPEGPPHYLVLACDSPAGLELTDGLKSHYERLIAEAKALFGARHYRSYRFLVTMSDYIRPTGIEHHECSDDRVPERFLLDDTYRKLWTAWLLPHEYVHSWNGKYRRPEGLATADFQQPMKTRLLWVYEGLTEYLGFVLAGRSGLYTPELSRENLALIADWARNQGGRTWRPLEDTSAPEVKPYTFDDIVQSLNRIVEHDWKAFLEKRLTATEAEPPLDGLARGGWKVVYRDKAGELFKARDGEEKSIDLTAALGLLLKDDGTVIDVVPGKPADQAGVGPGMKLVAVNGRRWSTERLHQAVAATQRGEKLRLLLENGDYLQTMALGYAGGERYPHLERESGKPDLLADIFRPLTGNP